MPFYLYRQTLSGEPPSESSKLSPVSEEELEASKRILIEYAKENLPVFEANHRYLRNNYVDLLKQFPDRLIAVYGEQVVANAADIGELLEILEQQGIDRKLTLVEFLNTDTSPVIL